MPHRVAELSVVPVQAGAVMGESALPVELGRLARAGRLDQLEHLARNGTDMDAADEDGRTCLHLARQHVHRKRQLPTQAFQAAALGFWAVWSFLRGAPEEPRREVVLRPSGLIKSRRLCHATQAAAYGHKHVVEFLANVGANLGAVDLIGRTALVYATQQHHQHVIKYLQGLVGQPLEERPRFNAAVTGEFDASPIRWVSE